MTNNGSAGKGLSEDGCPRGFVIAVSAPSGAGKTTLCNMLIKEFDDIKLSVSYTTRLKRIGETDDVSYHFIDDSEFDNMIADGEFIEWAHVFGKKYGTAYKSVTAGSGNSLHDILLEIDVQGVEKLIKYYRDKGVSDTLITIFIKPPSCEDLRDRLKKRGDMGDKELKSRCELSYAEMEQSRIYDYIITNDDLDEAYLKLKSIIIAERCRNVSKYKI